MPSNVSQKKLDAKTCFRCGTTSHLANYPKCPAKQSNCRQCGKVGHFARVCRSSASTCNVQEVAVPELTVLSVEMPLKQKQHFTCTVSLHTEGGKSVDTELLVDTGSAVFHPPRASVPPALLRYVPYCGWCSTSDIFEEDYSSFGVPCLYC